MNIVLILEKCETKASCRRLCFASACNCSACTVVRCGRTDLIDLFTAAFVNSQIAQVDTVVLGFLSEWSRFKFALWRSLWNFTFFFFFYKLRTEKILSLSAVEEWLFTPNNNCLGASYSLLVAGYSPAVDKIWQNTTSSQLNASKWYSTSGSSINTRPYWHIPPVSPWHMIHTYTCTSHNQSQSLVSVFLIFSYFGMFCFLPLPCTSLHELACPQVFFRV